VTTSKENAVVNASVETDQDRSIIGRRAAMKAALGGAAVAAVASAPSITSFSQTPDYASAASCDVTNSFTDRYTSTGGSAVNYCWGAWGSDANCYAASFGPSDIGTLPDTFQGVWTGNPFVAGGGTVSVQKGSGTRDCTVQVQGVCGTGAGTWTGDTATYALTSTAKVITLGCTSSCTNCLPYGAKATLTVSCIC